MKSINKNLIFKLIIASIIVFLAAINVSARVYLNGAGSGYEENEENGDSKNLTIEEYLIAGGGYYLSACSDIQKFLYLYEIQNENAISIDYNKMYNLLENAMDKMTHAVETYDQLIKKAEVTPYNEIFTAQLMAFDYTGYMYKNGLNSVVFQRLAEYLKRGDITGLFKLVYSDLTNIKDMLYSISKDVSMKKLPEISIIRKIYESYSTLSLLGSYASRVFYENLKIIS
jgi:hypothetical protein